MRIAILGSVATKIPPDGQAAIESLVYHQVLGLSKRGHEVYLFAPKGSYIPDEKVKMIEVGEGGTLSGIGKEKEEAAEKKLGASYKLRREIANLGLLISKLIELKDEFDIVLNNLRGEAVVVPVADLLHKPLVHIMHLPIFPELAELFHKYNTPLISISDAQRVDYPDLNYIATVYNAVDTDFFAFNENPQDYFLYLGSIGRNKNPKDAIVACQKAGVKLMMGGRIKDREYYQEEIATFIDGDHVKWIGEVHPKEVVSYYQKAKGFLFPTLWREPFGLVMIEALSCGTPVIAYPNGAVPEVVSDGYNGYIVADSDSMADKILKITNMDKSEERNLRQNSRKSVEEKFTVDRMVEGLEEVLNKVLG